MMMMWKKLWKMSPGGNSVNRGAPMIRSGMDRDFRGESRRSENSSFVIGGGNDDDVEEIMEDEQKFTGGFSKFGNMSRGGSIMSNMRDSNSFGGFNNSSNNSFTSRGNNFGSNVNRGHSSWSSASTRGRGGGFKTWSS